MEIYELQPRTNRKSFYGKAIVVEKGNIKLLKSYNTDIIACKQTESGLYVKRLYDVELSNTTCRHLMSFINMHKHQFEKLKMNKWTKIK